MNQSEVNTNSIRAFALAALIFGGFSIAFFFTGFLPLVFGGMSIICAVLSRREDRPFPSMSWWGVMLSCIGIFMGVLILAYAIIAFVIPMMNDPTYYQEMKNLYQNLYGINLDDYFLAQ